MKLDSVQCIYHMWWNAVSGEDTEDEIELGGEADEEDGNCAPEGRGVAGRG